MVGVPRSKGCRVCVQRRVRCDLTRPTCNNCKKGNRPCPGFEPDLKFQDEGERLRRRFAQKEARAPENEPSATTIGFLDSSSSSVSPDSTRWIAVKEQEDETSHALVSHRNTSSTSLKSGKTLQSLAIEDVRSEADLWPSSNRFYTPDTFEAIKIASILMSPLLAQQQILHQFQKSLSPSIQTMSLAQQMRSHERWLSYLPPLTGRNHLLDTAVRAVSLAHLSRLHHSDVFLHESRPYYGKAIRLLNWTLSDHEQGRASETLSATILLAFYEMFVSDSNESWIHHAGGAGALMRVRGPERHRYGFDREIFMAFRHTIIIESFQTDETCFLSEPKWRALSRDIHEDIRSSGIDAGQMELFDLTEMFYDEMLLLPAILHDGKHLESEFNSQKDRFSSVAEFRDDLIERCNSSRAGLKGFYARFRACLSKLGYDLSTIVTHDPVISFDYSYPGVFVASTCTGLWTVLIILNFVLIAFHKSSPDKVALYKAENRECALEICRSTSYLLMSSFLGPFFNILGLRTCLLAFGHPDEREWVLNKLFEIGQTHMAMAQHIPGFRSGDAMPTVRAALIDMGGIPTLEDITGV
jgi:Fungal specific transcription factor domain/Fungal Zn(2)-Cys(6) binuclear cluster domain